MKHILQLAALAITLPAFAQTSPPEEFTRCIDSLQGAARAAGVSESAYRRFTQDLQPDMSVIEKLDYQPEFRMPIWDYLSGLVDEERVAEGRARMAEHAQVLARVQQRFGVDPATVVAVWGVESNFGQSFGTLPLVRSLGTLSCIGRRQAYFRTELYAALRILQAGHIAPERLQGSWAGAFGHTQFMPSTFERLAVDFDGDGKADLMDSTSDALASTANYLKRAGWRSGEPWGYEISVPKGFDTGLAGRTSRRPLSDCASGSTSPGAGASAASRRASS